MKVTISKICRFVSFVGGVAIAGFLTLALGNSPACAQVETVLHNFADGTVANDGEIPYAGLTLASDGNYYGTTQYGGSTASGGQNDGLGWGAVYKTTPNGVELVRPEGAS